MAIARIRTVLSGWTGGPGLNTFYFKGSSTTPSAAEINDAGARVRAFWANCASTIHSSILANVNPSVDIVNEATGDLIGGAAISPAPATVNGTGSGEIYAPGICVNLVEETGIVILRRRLRGHSYIGPLTETSVANGVLASANVTLVLTAAAGLLAITPTSVTPVVWHRPVRGAGGSISGITSFSVSNRLSHLRTRRD